MRHLQATARWLANSELSTGGSAAHYTPLIGWSRAYPETTGYTIPSLIKLAKVLGEPSHEACAVRFGAWLLSIQNSDGSWNGGLHPNRAGRPSVFNTGQVLKGMHALWKHDGDRKWLEAGNRGNEWLASRMGDDGLWGGGDYRSSVTSSYYSHVLWPMLAMAVADGNDRIHGKVARGLSTILGRMLANGVVQGWAFAEKKPAYTHTIAYTIRGIQECSRLLGQPELERAVAPALEVLVRRSELAAGRLPGAFDESWRPVGNFVCLTGNAQVALSLLLWEGLSPDLRIVSAAARLVDFVCAQQNLSSRTSGLCGAVAGSTPIYGPYMRFRYPNWAAKYHCDALMALIARLDREI